MINIRFKRGFMAVTAVLMVALGTLAVSLTALASAANFSDMVSLHDARIQAQFDADACLDHLTLMAAKDYFLSGNIVLSEFDCVGHVINDANGHISIFTTSTLGQVVIGANRTVTF